MANLFTSQTPASGNIFDNAAVTLATTIVFDTPGSVSGGRFYAPSSPSGTHQLVLFQATDEDLPDGSGVGTALATANFGALTPSAWNSVSFSSPVAVAANTGYKIAVRSSLGSYTATSNFFTSSGLTNGHILGPQGGVLVPGVGAFYNGSFAVDAVSYPNKQSNQACYFVDVEFNTGTPFTKDTAEAYRVFNAITKDIGETYRLYNAFSKDAAEVYRILNGLTVNVAEAYRVFNSWTKDQSDTWNVTSGIQLNVVERYRVFSAWVRALNERYNVFSDDAPPALEPNAVASLDAVTVTAYLNRIP